VACSSFCSVKYFEKWATIPSLRRRKWGHTQPTQSARSYSCCVPAKVPPESICSAVWRAARRAALSHVNDQCVRPFSRAVVILVVSPCLDLRAPLSSSPCRHSLAIIDCSTPHLETVATRDALGRDIEHRRDDVSGCAVHWRVSLASRRYRNSQERCVTLWAADCRFERESRDNCNCSLSSYPLTDCTRPTRAVPVLYTVSQEIEEKPPGLYSCS